jgi:threonine dehydratase
VAPGADLDLSAAAVSEARAQAADAVRETPVFPAGWLTRGLGGTVALKAENLQRTGSFKVRGVAVKLARDPADAGAGVVAASAGNHGQALAYVASRLGLPCRIFIPGTASLAKAHAIESRGATIESIPSGLEGCVEAARTYAEETGASFVHPFDDPAVVLGQATLGLELAEQVPDLAKVVVPIGGGGLICGVAGLLKALRPDVVVAGVQSDACAPVLGRPTQGVDVRFVLADGIAVKEPGELTRPLIDRWVDELCTVSEDAIADAMVELLQRSKLVVEGAGAAPVAALRTGAVEVAPEGTTVALLSGGNLDLGLVSAIARLHEAAAGRSVQIATTVPDHPGGLAELLARIAAEGGNVIDVQHVRDIGRRGIHETRVEMVLELRGTEHKERLLAVLEAEGYAVKVLQP